ncbi:hypothetical protein ANO14919_043480 [Xylariales sp. No.14919]|nr:hypothetical protein ANO14919_043480 [Xylariales sp. No.14919]
MDGLCSIGLLGIGVEPSLFHSGRKEGFTTSSFQNACNESALEAAILLKRVRMKSYTLATTILAASVDDGRRSVLAAGESSYEREPISKLVIDEIWSHREDFTHLCSQTNEKYSQVSNITKINVIETRNLTRNITPPM